MTDSRRLEYMALDDIQPADRNAKRHDDDLIGASVARFGFIETPVIDERTGKLVGGHGRIDELRRRRDAGEPAPDGVTITKDGAWTVPVTRGWASRNDDEAHAAGIALNRIGERGGWDIDELHADLIAIAETDIGLDGIGFDSIELDDLLDALHMTDDSPGGPLAAQHSTDETGRLPHSFAVVVECTSEQQQVELLERLSGEGLAVRALTA